MYLELINDIKRSHYCTALWNVTSYKIVVIKLSFQGIPTNIFALNWSSNLQEIAVANFLYLTAVSFLFRPPSPLCLAVSEYLDASLNIESLRRCSWKERALWFHKRNESWPWTVTEKFIWWKKCVFWRHMAGSKTGQRKMLQARERDRFTRLITIFPYREKSRLILRCLLSYDVSSTQETTVTRSDKTIVISKSDFFSL